MVYQMSGRLLASRGPRASGGGSWPAAVRGFGRRLVAWCGQGLRAEALGLARPGRAGGLGSVGPELPAERPGTSDGMGVRLKPASFVYHRAGSVPEAIASLAQLGDEAKILAGGLS